MTNHIEREMHINLDAEYPSADLAIFELEVRGMFFGFIGGALFTMYFGKKFKEEFQKQLDKVKK